VSIHKHIKRKPLLRKAGGKRKEHQRRFSEVKRE
jgi:hypothetical protein